ncbi:MAG: DUF499 domain-containing protein [Polyangiaceae bacterium]
MKPWREVCRPHPDVLKDKFLQAEFAADISAVRSGNASKEYTDPAAFFERTVITGGMRALLLQVARRLNGTGGEPVIQLQTGFGGGKTHTMLAVYHLAQRSCPLQDLRGIPSLLDEAGLMDLPRANAALLDGHARGPGQPLRRGALQIHTLWGDLAYELGGEEGYAMVREADETGTSPGKEILRRLLSRYAPCVVLVDELVAYLRQFPEGKELPGGTYDSNLSFVQALTEAVKQVPNAVLLASLPQSEIEAGSSHGQAALKAAQRTLSEVDRAQTKTSLAALEKTFGRVQALWKPIATEEAFEIVRRRLFQPIEDEAARDEVCRAFAKMYVDEGSKVPPETHEARYLERLTQAYPIHPEVFDRLFEDWSTLDGFQKTRGVLKLMALVIAYLWHKGKHAGDALILPSSLPLEDSTSCNELTGYLPPGWEAVVQRDIDGDRSVPVDLDKKEARFGGVHAAVRVTRTLFLGTAPASGGRHQGNRGIDRARVLLGCLQPGQSAATFSDALSRLADRLHYLNSSGEKGDATTRFWFDTRANLRREMEERKSRFTEDHEVRNRLVGAVKAMAHGQYFEAIHPMTPEADIEDTSALRLVFLPLDCAYSKQHPTPAQEAIARIVRPMDGKVRHRANRLVFVAPDAATVGRLIDAARTALSWGSIIDDIDKGRLNVDGEQRKLAQQQVGVAEEGIKSAARACFRWLIAPTLRSPTDRDLAFDVYALGSGGSFLAELERVSDENDVVTKTWSPILLRDQLKALYWKDGVTEVRAKEVWEDLQKYLYLPRLKSKSVLEQAIQAAAVSRDFFGTAYGKAGDKYEGFRLGGASVQLDDSLLLIDLATAIAYESAQRAAETSPKPIAGKTGSQPPPDRRGGPDAEQTGFSYPTGSQPGPKHFHGSVEVNATTAKMKLVAIAEEIIAVLTQDPNAEVRVSLEIDAEFPSGASDQIKRAVSENASTLGFKVKEWERE